MTSLQKQARRKTLVMGVLNATPDSFFDGGDHAAPEAAVAHARKLAADGADIIDVGGESSRPGAEPVPVEREIERIMPVLEMAGELGVPLSIDSYHAETARYALERGAAMVNDITALLGDPEMAAVVAHFKCDCVLMHMKGTPRTMQTNPVYEDVVDDIRVFFEQRIEAAVAAGIDEDRIWLDPGFGFGKTVAHNLQLLRRLGELSRLGRPLLVGTSNKSTICRLLGDERTSRRDGTAATVAIAIAHGAACVRVHDVQTMGRVARMSDAIMGNMHD